MPATPDLLPPYSLAGRLRDGATLLAGWVCHPEPHFAEVVAGTDLDAVVFDAQHGLHGTVSLERCIAVVAQAGKPALVRIPVGDHALAARVLDMGAAGVIAPMVDSAADARRLVEFVKYPPVGRRSWGPGKALAFSGVTAASDHLARANGFTLALAMIETPAALAAVEEILAVDGLDGVFVGPYDLSVGLSNGALVDPDDPRVTAALSRIVAATTAAGKIAGIFGGDRAGERARHGFRFVTVGADTAYIRAGVAAMLAAARG